MKIGKGSILRFDGSYAYSAKKGALAKVTMDFDEDVDQFIMVSWICEKRNGQGDGGYSVDSFDVVELVKPTPKRLPQNDNRQFEFTSSGKDVALFLSQLLKDKDFDIDEEMTDAYLMEVGYELGWTDDCSKYVISILKEKSIIR